MTGRWTAGVDLGGTNIKVGLVGPAGQVAHASELPASGLRTPKDFVDVIDASIARSLAAVRAPERALTGVAVGVPGPVDAERGLVHTLVNLPGWREVPLKRLLESRFKRPCAVDNDANLIALAEWKLGAGRGSRFMAGLTLGTGVGGGFVFNGLLYRGVGGSAGEVGHTVIDPDGPACGCGARGCLEAHIGTAAILRMGRGALTRSRGALRRLVAAEAQGRLTPKLLSQAARSGDAEARKVWQVFGRYLGLGLANLINVLNPDRIVIGGGVSGAWPLFAPAMRAAIDSQALEAPAREVRITQATLGNHAGILGAAVLLWSNSQGQRVATTRRDSA
jgi:glucokinase